MRRSLELASYVHVCTACGARLTVHERYFGKNLRCTRCRTEFVARVPSLGGGHPAVVKPSQSEAEPSFLIVCGGCGSRLRLRERHLGGRLTCPNCGTEVTASEGTTARSASRPAAGAPAPQAVPTPVEAPVDRAPPVPTPAPPTEREPQPPPSDRPPAELARSYLHVCAGCGAEMTVHERYYGKTLRCTSCRAAFEADPSVVAGQPQPVMESLGGGVADTRRRWRWLAVSVAVVAVVAALLWWLGGDRTGGFASELFKAKKTRTELGVLRRGGGHPVPVALDRETLDELIRAVEDRDDVALDRLVSSSRCLELAEGTRVRVLERRKRAVETRVRVLDGPWASRIVWVPIQWIR